MGMSDIRTIRFTNTLCEFNVAVVNDQEENTMPLVTLTVYKHKPAPFTAAVLDAVHAALVASGVPETDRFQRVLELDREHFIVDSAYPDLTAARNDDFVLIEILLSLG